MTIKVQTNSFCNYKSAELEAKEILNFYEKLGYVLKKIALKHWLFVGDMSYYVMWFSKKETMKESEE